MIKYLVNLQGNLKFAKYGVPSYPFRCSQQRNSVKVAILERRGFVELHDKENPLNIPKHIIYRKIFSKTEFSRIS